MVSIQMDASEMTNALGNLVKNLPKELNIVANKTTTRTKSFIAKEVVKELAVTQKTVRKSLKVERRGKTGRKIVIEKTLKLPVAGFRPRQTKLGVTFKSDKRKPRRLIPGAFMGAYGKAPKWGGKVYKREVPAKTPIVQLHTASPWGAFVRRKKIQPTKAKINAELRKQLKERLRYQRLKKSGAI